METANVYNTMVAIPVVCGYALAERRGLPGALAAGAGGVVAVLVILHVWSPHPLLGWDTLKNVALVGLPLALGVAAHDRRAVTAALVERAETAERRREEETRRRLGEERLRIARDVHDSVAHAMVTINVQAGVGAHLLHEGGDADAAGRTLRDIKGVSGEALAELRSMLGILRTGTASSDVVDGMGGPWAPTRPLHRLSDLAGLGESLGSAGVDLVVDIEPGVMSGVSAPVESAAYRIVQEALTNVVRHASPTRASVRVSRDARRLLLEVLDEGGTSPRAPQVAGSRSGLRGMRERAVALGGSLEAGPRPAGGWRVAAALPVAPVVGT